MTAERRTGPERRRRGLALRIPDRRTGFDRRSPGGLLAWYRDHPTLVAASLVAIVLFNLADYLLTVEALERGAREVNPIMAALFERDPHMALVFKLATASGVVLVLWRLRRYRRMLGVSLVALGGFGMLVAYQIALVGSLG